MSMLLQAANMCIYCARSDAKLTTEHVIPHALNGKIKIPQAVCPDCQDIINDNIESRLLANDWAVARAKGKYLSRTDNAKKKAELQFRMLNGTYRYVLVRCEDMPVHMAYNIYELPPFLSFGRSAYSRIKETGIMYADNALVRKMMADYCPFSVGVQFRQHGVTGHMDSLLRKIACGLLFDTDATSAITSEIGQCVISGDSNVVHHDGRWIASDVFSAPRKYSSFTQRSTQAATFEICENGQRFLYAEICFFPDIISENYYVRIPSLRGGVGSVRTGRMIKIEYGNSRRQSYLNFTCQAMN